MTDTDTADPQPVDVVGYSWDETYELGRPVLRVSRMARAEPGSAAVRPAGVSTLCRHPGNRVTPAGNVCGQPVDEWPCPIHHPDPAYEAAAAALAELCPACVLPGGCGEHFRPAVTVVDKVRGIIERAHEQDLVLATDLICVGYRNPATGAIAAGDPNDIGDPPADSWQPVYVEKPRPSPTDQEGPTDATRVPQGQTSPLRL